jgi:hypothetical protein
MSYQHEKVISKLQLQARKSPDEPWGVLNTVFIPILPDIADGKALKQAKAEVEHLRNRWIENYDPTMQFRVVPL